MVAILGILEASGPAVGGLCLVGGYRDNAGKAMLSILPRCRETTDSLEVVKSGTRAGVQE